MTVKVHSLAINLMLKGLMTKQLKYDNELLAHNASRQFILGVINTTLLQVPRFTDQVKQREKQKEVFN